MLLAFALIAMKAVVAMSADLVGSGSQVGVEGMTSDRVPWSDLGQSARSLPHNCLRFSHLHPATLQKHDIMKPVPYSFKGGQVGGHL